MAGIFFRWLNLSRDFLGIQNNLKIRVPAYPGPGGGTPHNGLYGEAPFERGTFFRLQVYKRLGISRAEVYERVGKSVI